MHDTHTLTCKHIHKHLQNHTYSRLKYERGQAHTHTQASGHFIQAPHTYVYYTYLYTFTHALPDRHTHTHMCINKPYINVHVNSFTALTQVYTQVHASTLF